MKLKFKENPKEWRKSVLLPCVALAVISSLLRWRKILPARAWYIVLGLAAVLAVCAWLQPRWFRGWYRVSMRLGFITSQCLGHVFLFLIFIGIITPLGWMLRLAGKDPLQLKRQPDSVSYWNQSSDATPLERLF
jgi:hypothetical protein